MKFRRNSKKKKYRQHGSPTKGKDRLFIDDGGTQCGSQVPLVNQGKYSDASDCGTASMSPSGSHSTASFGTPERKEKKNGLFCMVNRARTRSSSKAKPFDEGSIDESWTDAWQEESPLRPGYDPSWHVDTTQRESPESASFQQDYPDRPIPVSTSFPFDEDKGEDLVSCWINDDDSDSDEEPANTVPSRYAVNDQATASETEDDGSSRGAGSIYTYGTGFSRFSGDSGLDTYESTSHFNGLKLLDQTSITTNSLAQSSVASNSLAQSSAASTTNSLAYSQSSVSGTDGEGVSLLDEIQDPHTAKSNIGLLGSFDRPFSPQGETVKAQDSFELQAWEDETPIAGVGGRSKRKKKKKPDSVGDFFADFGLLAGEIFLDVRDSVSCAVDTTVKTLNYDGTPCFSGDKVGTTV